MKYIICTYPGCESPLWGCIQGKLVLMCETDCWPKDGKNYNCPKDARIVEELCPLCRNKPAPKNGV